MLSLVQAKLLAIAGVSIGSYICGFISVVLGVGSRLKESVLLSSVLCFGAGVLLATSIVHILPDVKNDIPQWGEVLICVGFFFIYSVDVIISLFRPNSEVGDPKEQDFLLPQEANRNYGSIDNENEPSVTFSQDNLESQVTQQWSLMNYGLLIAFTTHALLEGLIIGIQDSTSGVWLLLGAVCSHKLLVAFCLGVELISDGRPWQMLICPLSVFVFGSDLGIIFGMIFEIDGFSFMRTAIPYIEGIAGGTLLYIALCEIIPREKARKLPRYASIPQIIGMFSGFLVMSALSILI